VPAGHEGDHGGAEPEGARPERPRAADREHGAVRTTKQEGGEGAGREERDRDEQRV